MSYNNYLPASYMDYLPPKEESYDKTVEALYPEFIEEGKHLNSVTFQVTEDCCMKCTYCYQHNKSKNKMTFEVAKKFIDDLLTDKYENINTSNTFGIYFDFIGGEPLLEIELIDKISTYTLEKMIELKHPWLRFIRFSFSSNGLLYNTPEFQNYLDKFGSVCSLGISVDGNKELHDSCRIDLNGNGTYDRVIEAVRFHNKKYDKMPSTKMTVAPENINYLYDAIINLIQEKYTVIMLNCVFEDVWNVDYARILYNQLKLIADYLLENDLYDKIFVRMLDEELFCPLSEDYNENACGGTTTRSMSLDYSGNLYPCIRYMESSLNGNQKPIIIGDIYQGYNSTELHKNNLEKINNITRRSQSTDECFYCPIATGCSWCSAYNYEVFGTPNKRATFICIMHKAMSMANVYYWNKLYKKLFINKTFKMHIPKEWALEIIDENEYNYLLNLSEGK